MRIKVYLLLFLLTLMIIQNPVSAQEEDFEIETSNIAVEIGENDTYTYLANLTILITSSSDINTLDLSIDTILSNVKTQINGSLVANAVQIESSTTQVSITSDKTFTQQERITVLIRADLTPNINPVENNQYQLIFKWAITPMADTTNISITLPYGAIITSNQDDLNIFPSASDIDSDGSRLTVSWTGLAGTAQNTQLFIQYTQKNLEIVTSEVTQTISDNNRTTPLIIVLIIFITLLTGLAGFLYYQLEHKELGKDKSEKSNNDIKIVKVIKPVVLNPSEKEILKLIADAGGAVNQSELVNLLDVSKARVSQYLSDFEERNLIKKEKMGRQNLIKLNIDKQDIQQI